MSLIAYLASPPILLLGMQENVFSLHPKNIRRARKKMDPEVYGVLTASLDTMIRDIEGQEIAAGELTKHEKHALRKFRHIRRTLDTAPPRRMR